MPDARDILTDAENEVMFFNGDFQIGFSDGQHIQHILQASKGNFIEYPTVGAGITEYKNGNITQAELSKRIRVELEKDGYHLKSVSVINGEVKIDAKRIK